jgi:cell division protease FtsH
LASAVAGEAEVPFFSISGSDFVEMFVGVGASRVRDLFDNAKKNAPCIIFIDEIDAVGRHRGAGMGGGHDEREQTLNQLLVEMDGFGPNEGVIIIAATNRIDILDPALLRPGRFDRRVFVMLPDIKGREEILKVHAKGKPIAAGVDLRDVAKNTPGFTGADLANVLNEAALLAARHNLKEIDYKTITEATFKVMIGPEKKSRVINDKEKRLTAVHEGGHAIVLRAISETDKVERVSIIPAGGAGGYTAHRADEDIYYTTRKQMIDKIMISLGGRAAEELVFGEISTGASSDLQSCNAIARSMITKYGMSDKLKNLVFGSEDEIFLGRDFGHVQGYSEQVSSQIDQEVKVIIDEAYEEVIKLLKDKMALLHIVAGRLLEKEKIEGDEFEAIYASDGKNLEAEIASDVISEQPRATLNETTGSDIRSASEKSESERLSELFDQEIKKQIEQNRKEKAANNEAESDSKEE